MKRTLALITALLTLILSLAGCGTGRDALHSGDVVSSGNSVAAMEDASSKDSMYAGDDASTSELEYCQTLNPEIAECAVFTSSFHIPEQDVQMAGAFEPNTDINGYSWFLGKNTAGEWEVLTNGFG